VRCHDNLTSCSHEPRKHSARSPQHSPQQKCDPERKEQPIISDELKGLLHKSPLIQKTRKIPFAFELKGRRMSVTFRVTNRGINRGAPSAFVERPSSAVTPVVVSRGPGGFRPRPYWPDCRRGALVTSPDGPTGNDVEIGKHGAFAFWSRCAMTNSVPRVPGRLYGASVLAFAPHLQCGAEIEKATLSWNLRVA